MTLKDKAKTYNFWISLVSAVVLIVRIIGNKFNIFIDTTLIMDVTTGLCSIFVILGILSAPKSKEKANQESIKTEDKQPSIEDNKIDAIEDDKNINSIITTEANNETPEVIVNEESTVFDKESKDDTTQEEHTEVSLEETTLNDKESLNNTEDCSSKTKLDFLPVLAQATQAFVGNINNSDLQSLIENLKSEIHKANMVIEKLTKTEE